MIPVLVQIVFGWPAILGSLLISAVGVGLKRPYLLGVGAVYCLGFAWYVSGSPLLPFQVVGLTLPLQHLAGAWAVSRGKPWAWLFLLPHAMVAAYLAAAVLSQ